MIEIKESQRRHWIYYNGQARAAYTLGYHRSHVWPLYTPDGVCVIQEYPPDHVHHQGLMVGQDLVNGHNFWAAGHPTHPSTRQISQTLSTEVENDIVIIRQSNEWTGAGEEKVLQEERTIIVRPTVTETTVDIVSTRIAAYGAVLFGQTKEAGIGMRYNPEMEGPLGGCIESSDGGVGEAETFGKEADWIAVCASVSGRRAGVAILPYPDSERCPWFTRDYGITLYNPSYYREISLAEGEQYTLAARFIAYDGPSDSARLNELYAILKEERVGR